MSRLSVSVFLLYLCEKKLKKLHFKQQTPSRSEEAGACFYDNLAPLKKTVKSLLDRHLLTNSCCCFTIFHHTCHNINLLSKELHYCINEQRTFCDFYIDLSTAIKLSCIKLLQVPKLYQVICDRNVKIHVNL